MNEDNDGDDVVGDNNSYGNNCDVEVDDDNINNLNNDSNNDNGYLTDEVDSDGKNVARVSTASRLKQIKNNERAQLKSLTLKNTNNVKESQLWTSPRKRNNTDDNEASINGNKKQNVEVDLRSKNNKRDKSIKSKKNTSQQDSDDEWEWDIKKCNNLIHRERKATTMKMIIFAQKILNARKCKGWRMELLVEYNTGERLWVMIHGALKEMPYVSRQFMTDCTLTHQMCGYVKDPTLYKGKKKLGQYDDYKMNNDNGIYEHLAKIIFTNLRNKKYDTELLRLTTNMNEKNNNNIENILNEENNNIIDVNINHDNNINDKTENMNNNGNDEMIHNDNTIVDKNHDNNITDETEIINNNLNEEALNDDNTNPEINNDTTIVNNDENKDNINNDEIQIGTNTNTDLNENHESMMENSENNGDMFIENNNNVLLITENNHMVLDDTNNNNENNDNIIAAYNFGT